jgi:hypothetical protein
MIMKSARKVRTTSSDPMNQQGKTINEVIYDATLTQGHYNQISQTSLKRHSTYGQAMHNCSNPRQSSVLAAFQWEISHLMIMISC